MNRKLWHLGNTTVRSPFRLREGLLALSKSELQGNLHGEEQEKELCKLLGESGIVDLKGDETYSVGRKWRSALNKLGFVYPELPRDIKEHQAEVGQVDTITENGKRLIDSETVPAMQECFLRALAAYSIPNPSEKDYDFAVFSPLKFVLEILLELQRSSGEASISFIELALFVIPNSPADGVNSITEQILEFRAQRQSSQNKRAFDNKARAVKAEELDYATTTFDDYGDTTIRYLKATGLVVAKGRGLAIFDDKRAIIERMVAGGLDNSDPINYYRRLTRGAELPTDELLGAIHVYEDVRARARTMGIEVLEDAESSTSVGDINTKRHNLEERMFQVEEENYARNQANLSDEILCYMDALISNQRSKNYDEGSVFIPSSERPAYLEWILWRAFLAINNLRNKPYQARRFKVDQSFLPIGTAPGNGPDLIFEFDDLVLVVEATLTENSRQEAAEGETVRRHVTDTMALYPGKPVYGLFIAKNINTNTAHTFKIGIWYATNDQQIGFSIVPITLAQFKAIYMALMSSGDNRTGRLKTLLDSCILARESADAPAWKIEIGGLVSSFVSR